MSKPSTLILSVLFLTSSLFAQTDSVRRHTSGKDVIVTGFPADQGITPVPVAEIDRKRIEQLATVQDPPKLIALTPSATFFSQSGTDIGYSFVSLRGFEQRRLSILVNGVPQNDPEDHNVYWIDMPDLTSYSGNIQVQRGAGSAFYGPPAIGGSINLETHMPTKKALSVLAGYGDYNTKKLVLEGSSGLVMDNWMFHGRLSKTTTDGYRNHSFVDLLSYYFSIKRVSEDHTLQANFFGGPISDGLNYYGLGGKGQLKDREERKRNWSELGPPSDTVIDRASYERMTGEIEQFFQPHFELLSSYRINPLWTLSNTLFYVQGDGEFDMNGGWVRPFTGVPHPVYYRLTAPYAARYGFAPLAERDTTFSIELVRAHVGNKQFGWLPRLDYEFDDGGMTFGMELRTHRSLHSSSILSATGTPAGLPDDYTFIEYRGGKDIFSPYVAGRYDLDRSLTAFASMQLVAQKYRLYDERPFYADTTLAAARSLDIGWNSFEFEVPFLFVNPRLGLNVRFDDRISGFVSVSRTSREPRLADYYRADFFGEPNFDRTLAGYDFDKPRIRPETLLDVEAGVHIAHVPITDALSIRGSLNGYFMSFTDEILKTGKVDRFGASIVANAEETEHYGLEASVHVSHSDLLRFEINASQSRHRIKQFTQFGDSISVDGKRPIGFPEQTLTGILSLMPHKTFSFSAIGRYVGEFYGDLENSSGQMNDPYFVLDAILSYRVPIEFLEFVEVKLQANNVLDRLYTSYVEKTAGFFVAAPRHFYGSVEIGI